MITVSFKCRFRMLKGVIKDDSGCMRGSVSAQDSPSAQVQATPSFRQSIPEECKGRVTVELVKKEASSLGLSISGGADKESLAWVSNLRPGGVASRSDELCIGDLLRAVNGIRLSRLQHDEIVSLLGNVGKRAVLDVEYLLPSLSDGNTITKTLEVSLQKEVNSFGFILRGGFHPDSCKSRPLVIVLVRPGGPADREGSLRIGDRLVGVDGACVRAFSLEDVLALLKCCGHESQLLVEYDCCNAGTLRSESVPMTVELVETAGASLGIALSTTTFEMGQQAVIIENVRAGSAADRCGMLRAGDQLLAVDGVGLEHQGLEEAVRLLAGAGDKVRLLVMPNGEMTPESYELGIVEKYSLRLHQPMAGLPCPCLPMELPLPSPQSPSGAGPSPPPPPPRRRRGSGCTIPPSCFSSIPGGSLPRSFYSSYAGSTDGGTVRTRGRPGETLPASLCMSGSLGSLTVQTTRPEQQSCCEVSQPRHTPPSLIRSHLVASLGTSCQPPSFGQATRIETMTVELIGDPPGGGFGILLQGSTFSRTAAPLVAYIEPESPADRSGMLQVGDRLLVINGISTCGLSVAEAARYLQEAALAGSAKLELEFDVAESIVPSSGTFHIKLPKKKGTHIGIKLSSPARRKIGEPLIISDIQKGSIAHRTGTLECGVQLLAVGAASLEGATVSEAMQTLNRQDGFVRLTIRKNLWHSDTPTPAQEEEALAGMICYTVELRRYGGPLGITISGTETTCDPILISGLSRGGLAEKTGAIHIGDQILAIDGVSLQGRPLSEAIHLLQRAGENVCLNIVKRRWATDRQTMHHELHADLKFHERSSDSSPISDCSLTFPSMDSAVESWDSSTLETTCSSHGTLHGQGTSRSSGKRVEGSVDQRHSNTLHPPTHKAMSVDTHNMGDIFKDLSVVLHRSDDMVDFGFSITDTLAEQGVYVTSVRPGGPADRAGLKPLDRILQVNGVKAADGGCGTIIPLITDSPPGLELLVRRVRSAEPPASDCPGKGHSDSRRRSYPAFPGSPKPCLLGDGQGSLGRVILQSDTERVQPAGQEQQSNIKPL